MTILKRIFEVMASAQKKPKKSYHHGNLKQALLKEAERILEKDGLHGLSLRAAARAAGVSHAAPKNHFGDMTGLINELAAEGFRRLKGYLGAENPPTERELKGRLKKVGLGYIRFSREYPGLFTLMYRADVTDQVGPELKAIIEEVRSVFRTAITPVGSKLSPAAIVIRGTAFWSLIHGYGMLVAEGRLDGTLSALPGEDIESLFEKILSSVHL